MSKKDKKRKKKSEKQAIPAWAGRRASELIESYMEPEMHIEFTHEGKIYKGKVPCVGDVKS